MIKQGETAGSLPSFPGYDVIRRIGHGGMADVYLARQQALGRRLVAIKVLRDGMGSPETLARFRREAELMAQADHPNVLYPIDFGETDGRPFLVMEHLDGGDLRSLLTPGRPLSITRSIELLRPIGAALACLHAKGVVHRDLKPENVLLHRAGLLKVADFGIAVPAGASGRLTGTLVGLGTLGYVSPEQQYGLGVDERSDQYSFAAIAFEMLTGEVPRGTVKLPPSRRNPALSRSVDSTLLRGLSEDRSDRFPSVAAFLEALESATRELPVRPRRWAIVAALGSFCVLAALLIVVRPWHRSSPPPTPGPGLPSPDSIRGDPRPSLATDPLESMLLDQIEIRAYHGWEAKGRPEGSHKDDWTHATADLLGHGPLADRILHRIEEAAYFLWEREGRPEGRELDHWLAARQEFVDAHSLPGLIDQVAQERSARDGLTSQEAHRRLLAEGAILPIEYEDRRGLRYRLVTAGAIVLPDGRRLVLEAPIYVQSHEVTVAQYGRFADATGHRLNAESPSGDDDLPVTGVSWNDASAFCDWIGPGFRLPTVVEWEYACRAGSATPWPFGSDGRHLERYAWFAVNSGGQACPVGSREPNAMGIHDMLGNVAEWCSGPCADGEVASRHPACGGSWRSTDIETRLDQRPMCLDFDVRAPDVGFRACFIPPGVVEARTFPPSGSTP